MSKALQGTIVTVTRRYVDLLYSKEILRGTLASRVMGACVGDMVSFEKRGSSVVVNQIAPRKNCLLRSYGEKRKRLVSNLDLICIVSAVGELFNTVFIDRVLSVAYAEEIPVLLMVNKIDQKEALESIREQIDYYRKITKNVLLISALNGAGIGEFQSELEQSGIKQVALSGISGVGKSSLIKALIPAVEIRIREVSAKSGQGRQTTAQAVAFRYKKRDQSEALVVDLPGIQSFGVAHLDKSTLSLTFPEMREKTMRCQFKDCSHRDEESCAIIGAVERGEIALWRYESYLGMLEEIENTREY